VVNARKVAFVFVFIMMSSKPAMQSVFVLAVLMASLSLQVAYSPYERLREPSREVRSSSSSLMWLWSSVKSWLLRARDDPNVIEMSSLSSSIAVLLSGQLYLSSQLVIGEAKKVTIVSSNASQPLVDWACLSVIALSVLYMVVVLVLPLWRVLLSVLGCGVGAVSDKARVARLEMRSNPLHSLSSGRSSDLVFSCDYS
jgi:hypothetical protein